MKRVNERECEREHVRLLKVDLVDTNGALELDRVRMADLATPPCCYNG